MEIPKTIINLEALLIALAQQTEPLPEYLQRSLKEIERLLREEQPQAATQLRQLVKDFPPLEKAYKKAIEELDAAYANQERTKSLSVIFPDSLDFESLFINDVIPSQDWVKTAQKLAGSPLDHEGADSPRFWDKADRLMVVTVGGAALGGSIAGVYGAVIGAILAAGCGHVMTQKFHSCYSKDTLLAVDDQGGIAEPLEEDPKMLEMLLFRVAGNNDVIQVYEDEVQTTQNPVHVSLESVAGISESKSHPEELPQSKRRNDGRLGNVGGVHADLMVAFPQVHLGEDDTAFQPLCKVRHVGKRVRVLGGHQIEPPVVAARPPAAIWFHHLYIGHPVFSE